MQQADDAIENEFEQIAHRAIGEKLDRQRIQNACALRAALFLIDFDREIRGVRIAVDRDQLRRRFVGMKDDFAVAECDAVAGTKRNRVDDLDSVDERSIDASTIAYKPRAAFEDDRGVLAR